ncbi:hypothetical protein ACJX0J_013420, partial [Zea mays]
ILHKGWKQRQYPLSLRRHPRNFSGKTYYAILDIKGNAQGFPYYFPHKGYELRTRKGELGFGREE